MFNGVVHVWKFVFISRVVERVRECFNLEMQLVITDGLLGYFVDI